MQSQRLRHCFPAEYPPAKQPQKSGCFSNIRLFGGLDNPPLFLPLQQRSHPAAVSLGIGLQPIILILINRQPAADLHGLQAVKTGGRRPVPQSDHAHAPDAICPAAATVKSYKLWISR